MTKKIVTSFVFLLILLQVYAQHDLNSFSKLLDGYEENNDFNGIILIAEKGEIVFSRNIGYADFQNDIKLDLNTPMHLASNTKAFTNMGIMILAERGLISYDDKVIEYVQKFPYQDHYPSSYDYDKWT